MSLPIVSSQNMSIEKTNNILGFVRNLVPKRIKEGIAILLKPCCDLAIGNMSFVNVSGSTYNVTVNLTSTTSFYETPFIFLSQNGIVIAKNGIYLNGIVTFANVPLTAGSTNFSLTFLIPVASNLQIGTYKQTASFTIVTP